MMTSEEVDRRILSAEQRIKLWTVGGILTQITALAVIVAGGVFHLGQLSTEFNTTQKNMQKIMVVLGGRGNWMDERIYWESQVEEELVKLGGNRPKEMPSYRRRPDKMRDER